MPGLTVSSSDPSCNLPPVLPEHARAHDAHIERTRNFEEGDRIVFDLESLRFRFEDKRRRPITVDLAPALQRPIYFVERTGIQLVAALIAATHGFDIQSNADALTANADLWTFTLIRRQVR